MGRDRERAALRDARARADTLLDLVNAILLAYGTGPDGRLRVVNNYVGKRRRNVIVEQVTDGILVRLEPVKKEDPDGSS